MSKMLEASCVGGVVLAGGIPVVSAEILSEGVGPSTGVVFLDEDTAAYIPKTTPDLETTLTKLIDALDQAVTAFNNAVTALTAIDGKPQGTLSPVPVATANIAQIVTAAAAITAAKLELTVLKGMLR